MAFQPEFFDFDTESGIILKVRRPNRFEILKLEQRFIRDEPKPPTRMAKTHFGEEEIVIKGTESDLTEEQSAAFWEHQRARIAWLTEYGLGKIDFMILEYVYADIPGPQSEELKEIELTYKRLARFGTEPPYNLKDADDRKIAYIRHICVGTKLVELGSFMQDLMGATEKEVEEIEDSFRGDVGGAAADGRDGSSSDGGSAATADGDDGRDTPES